MHTIIIYEAESNTTITQPDGREILVKAGEHIAYDTANHTQFKVSKQEIKEQYTYVHNGQYVRKRL